MTTPETDLRKVQKLLTLILAELDRVCRRIGVSYAIYGGTAIGAIRHGGFIPRDDDARRLRAFLGRGPGPVG